MTNRIDLNGTWNLYWSDGYRGEPIHKLWTPGQTLRPVLTAQVPGEVHLDLMRAGLIKEPAVGLNAHRARWVEEMIWYYHRTFQAPGLAPGDRAYLVFEQLDLAAIVYLNGAEIGRHANAFRPLRIDVTGKLKPGENVLVVEIESGLFSVSDRPYSGYGLTTDAKLHKRQWLRKTQSSFGWDWSLRLVNVGISGGVRLEVCRDVRFDCFVAIPKLSADSKTGTVTGRFFVEGLGEKTHKGYLRLQIEGTSAMAETEVEIKPGLQTLEATARLDNPELWWPVGHGGQPLYSVRGTLTIDGAVVATDTRRVGFRHVCINQAPHPDSGSYFIIEINGKPIFCKGGNLAPAELIFARLNRQRYETLIARALEANFNLLRVWAGGLYESDHFYDLCDERGILVWQEFHFACAKYPATDEHFLADVKLEAAHQVRRLAHHPSLVVWCGNNELEWGSFSWGYERGVAHPDYALYHMVLPVIVKQEDGSRYYHPSSPYSPNHDHPNADDQGDQHPWSVGFQNTDFRDYRKMYCRFPNEGGILGPPALPTVRACLLPGQQYVGSFSWKLHDNSIACHGWADAMLTQWLGLSIESMSIEDYVYYGGIVQGEGLNEYIRNFRRRMFSTACAAFWAFNDSWPMVRGWTVVDYYLRRTPSFYPVRRAYQTVTIALAVEDGRVKVFGVNDGPAFEGEIRYGLFALAGGYPVDVHKRVSLRPNASTLVGEFEEAEWRRLGEKEHGAFAILSREGGEVAHDKLFLPFYKEMTWPKAVVTVRRESGKAIFESETFAWRVCLDLDGEKPLPDNFFDLLPGVPYVLDWPDSLGTPKVLRVGNLS